eukprot:TRINITY_DN23035_c0_g1_i1.p1 TRINITY_DN23035_c0_g1~~TRINITY_DN23035_c0_g1_i1.p1  ORF type:complete len:798 (+),score=151.89 TRINITY_DN23035_c0_g1_i1:152-2545(+)
MSIRPLLVERSAASSQQPAIQTSISNGERFCLPIDDQDARPCLTPREQEWQIDPPALVDTSSGDPDELESDRKFSSESTNGVNHPSQAGGLSTHLRRDHVSNENPTSAGVKRNGQHSGGNVSNSATARGRKGQLVNANHLLNFQHYPIQRGTRAQIQSSQARNQPRIKSFNNQPRTKAFNKDLFLQANFRFLVSDMGDYILNSSNPDKMLDWDNVALVNLSIFTPVHCPICLEKPPLCPQITTCGHIFCFPCVLRYLMMGEEDKKGYHWKKCPICSAMISCRDLYNVCFTTVRQYGAGDHIDLKLLSRAKTSVIPFEKNHYSSDAFPYTTDGQCNVFSKFTLTSDPAQSTRSAMIELTDWINRVETFGGEERELLPYVYAARDQLHERERAWVARMASEHSNSIPQTKQSLTTDMKRRVFKQRPNLSSSECATSSLTLNEENGISFHTLSLSDGADRMPEHSVTISDDSIQTATVNGDIIGPSSLASTTSLECNSTNSACITGSEKTKNSKNLEFTERSENILHIDEDTYAFYQAADGQLIILHPLNMKCLRHHFGNYDSLPIRISGRILQLDTVSQSEDSRKRYRYLSHFPLTTVFQLCEIDMSELLPTTAFMPFTDEIEKREAERRRQRRKEARARGKAAAAQAAEAKRLIPVTSGISTEERLPSDDDFIVLGQPKGISSSPPALTGRMLFSNVTRLGFAAAYDSPELKVSQARDSSSVGTGGSGKGEGHAGPSNSTQASTATSSPPTMSFLDATKASKSTRQECSDEASNSKCVGKKGKRATKVLLSTSGGRRY